MWIIIAGDPMDGFTFFGPFEDAADANSWADCYFQDSELDNWLTELTHPDQE